MRCNYVYTLRMWSFVDTNHKNQLILFQWNFKRLKIKTVKIKFKNTFRFACQMYNGSRSMDGNEAIKTVPWIT